MERFWPTFTDVIANLIILLGPTLSPTQPHPASNTCLKLWPVHGHAGPVRAAPPAQIFLRTGCLDALVQVPMELLEPMRPQSGKEGRPKPRTSSQAAHPEPRRGRGSLRRVGHTCHYWRGRGVGVG